MESSKERNVETPTRNRRLFLLDRFIILFDRFIDLLGRYSDRLNLRQRDRRRTDKRGEPRESLQREDVDSGGIPVILQTGKKVLGGNRTRVGQPADLLHAM